MQAVKRQVADWLSVLNNRERFAEILCTCEEIYQHFNEYGENDIRYIIENIVEILIDIMIHDETSDEIRFSIVSILTKMRPHIKNEGIRRSVFINASNIVAKYLKSYKKAKLIADLMAAYRPE